MINNKLKTIILRVMGSGITRNEEVVVKCPYCKHRKHKLSINLLSYKWHCWVCGVKGIGFVKLFRTMKASNEDIHGASEICNIHPPRKSTAKEDHVALPMEFVPILSGNTNDPEFRNAFRYLQSRGLGKIDILRHNIGFCASGRYKGYIIIPSYGFDGALNYFVGRSYYESDFPHKNPKVSKNVVGFELFVNWDEPINICEGVFDAFSIGENSIPLFGKFLPKVLERTIIENKVERVNIILDKDAAKTSLELATKLLSCNIQVYIVDLPNDSDPSDLGKDKMKELINESEPIDLTRILEMQFEL